MNGNQVKLNFIDECQKMTFEELGKYIEVCLEKLDKNKFGEEQIPKERDTYELLIQLMEG